MSSRGNNNNRNNQKSNNSNSPQSSSSSSSQQHNRSQRRRRGGSSSHRHSPNMHPGSSAMPVPSSRARRARRSGAHAKQTQQSMENSTWNQNKRNKIEDLKVGAPYDEWNSFFSQCSCDEILQELTLALKSQPNLDINVHPSGYKIRGRKFIDNFMIEFQIEMFYTTNKHKKYPNHILVEFQRRNGDGFVFQQFLHSIFKELQSTNLVSFSKFPINTSCYLSPTPLKAKGGPTGNASDSMDTDNDDNDENDTREEEKKHDNTHNNNNRHWHGNTGHNNNNRHQNNTHHDADAHWQQPPKQIDEQTLKMLIGALFAGDSQMCRSASSYLANNIANNQPLVYDIIKLEPHIITKFSDLLLKCVDPQIVRSVGCTLFHMLQQSDKLRNEALKLNVKTVCKKVYKRWTEPVETRYGSNNKYVIRVIPSMQVAQRMTSCIQVLE